MVLIVELQFRPSLHCRIDEQLNNRLLIAEHFRPNLGVHYTNNEAFVNQKIITVRISLKF